MTTVPRVVSAISSSITRLSPIPRWVLRKSSLLESVSWQMIYCPEVFRRCLSRTRRSVEMILTYLQETIPHVLRTPSPIPQLKTGGIWEGRGRVRGYRSGYLPHQPARESELGLRMVCQNCCGDQCLELGIDIRGLGRRFSSGNPGNIASHAAAIGSGGTWGYRRRSP